MVLCAACCDKEATLDFVAMEDKPYGRYIGKSVNVQNQHAIEKGKMWWPKQVYVMLWSTVLWDESHCKWQSAISKQIMNIFWISKSTSDLFSTGTAHIKISTQFPDSGRGVIQRRCQWRCHLPPAPPSPLPPPLPSPSSAWYWCGLLKPWMHYRTFMLTSQFKIYENNGWKLNFLKTVVETQNITETLLLPHVIHSIFLQYLGFRCKFRAVFDFPQDLGLKCQIKGCLKF